LIYLIGHYNDVLFFRKAKELYQSLPAKYISRGVSWVVDDYSTDFLSLGGAIVECLLDLVYLGIELVFVLQEIVLGNTPNLTDNGRVQRVSWCRDQYSVLFISNQELKSNLECIVTSVSEDDIVGITWEAISVLDKLGASLADVEQSLSPRVCTETGRGLVKDSCPLHSVLWDARRWILHEGRVGDHGQNLSVKGYGFLSGDMGISDVEENQIWELEI